MAGWRLVTTLLMDGCVLRRTLPAGFGRSMTDVAARDGGRFKGGELAFRPLEERLDTSSAGELVFHVFGAISHLERQLIV